MPTAPAAGPTIDDAAPGTGRIDWSQDELVHIGLPFALIEPTIGLDPADDLAWINALAGALEAFCGSLPAGPTVVAGTKAHLLADAFGLADVRYPNTIPRKGSACLTLPASTEGRGWVLGGRGERDLHLVLSGAANDGLLDLDPAVVSWIGDDALIAALWVCSTRGAVLGYGRTGKDRLLRATPTEVALQIRAMVGRR